MAERYTRRDFLRLAAAAGIVGISDAWGVDGLISSRYAQAADVSRFKELESQHEAAPTDLKMVSLNVATNKEAIDKLYKDPGTEYVELLVPLWNAVKEAVDNNEISNEFSRLSTIIATQETPNGVLATAMMVDIKPVNNDQTLFAISDAYFLGVTEDPTSSIRLFEIKVPENSGFKIDGIRETDGFFGFSPFYRGPETNNVWLPLGGKSGVDLVNLSENSELITPQFIYYNPIDGAESPTPVPEEDNRNILLASVSSEGVLQKPADVSEELNKFELEKIRSAYPLEIINNYEWNNRYGGFSRMREDGRVEIYRHNLSVENPSDTWVIISDEAYFPEYNTRIVMGFNPEDMASERNEEVTRFNDMKLTEDFIRNFPPFVEEMGFDEMIRDKTIHVAWVADYENSEDQVIIHSTEDGVKPSYAYGYPEVFGDHIVIRTFCSRTVGFKYYANSAHYADEGGFSVALVFAIKYAMSGAYTESPVRAMAYTGPVVKGFNTIMPLGYPAVSWEQTTKLVNLILR